MSNTRTLISANSPVYADPTDSTISLKCVFQEISQYGEVTFLATPNDVEPHGRAILARAKSLEFGPIGAYVPPAPKT